MSQQCVCSLQDPLSDRIQLALEGQSAQVLLLLLPRELRLNSAELNLFFESGAWHYVRQYSLKNPV